VADSSSIQFVAMDSLGACLLDKAQVSRIEGPTTAADSAANQITAQFCSDGSDAATVAQQVVDLPAGGYGKLKVVALDQNDPDSSHVIVSNEVTYNGGIVGDYAPVLLRASSTHETSVLRVTAVGAELASVEEIKVGAPDNLWSVRLTVEQHSNSIIVATADVYVPLPQAVVQAGSPAASSGQAFLPADQIITAAVMSAGIDTIFFRDPNPSIYPKDFAFHYNSVYDPTDPAHPWKGYFHLLYIRNKAGLDSIIAHAWTDSLGKPWSVDSMAFRPSGTGWDEKKVWAPSLQQVGDSTYMFYTGVDALGNQSIGYATTPMLGTTNISWTRRGSPSYRATDASWADTIGQQVTGVIQFRDPFVMPDPDVANYPGRYLLFNAGEDAALPTHYTIGVARNVPGTLNSWTNLGRYEATDHNHLDVLGSLESPLVVLDSLTGAWRMFVANGAYDELGHESTIFLTQNVGDSLTTVSASSWERRDTLYSYTGQDVDVIGWQACEHLQLGQVHFFAAFHGPYGIGITRMHWDPALQKFIFVHPDVTAVPSDADRSGVRFFLSGLRPGAGRVQFVIESASNVVPRLIVYDVTGRQVRKLTDGRVVQGRSEVTWDCRDGAGKQVPTGMYFARMTEAGRAQVVRVPILR
jgi:hypothetical protein